MPAGLQENEDKLLRRAEVLAQAVRPQLRERTRNGIPRHILGKYHLSGILKLKPSCNVFQLYILSPGCKIEKMAISPDRSH